MNELKQEWLVSSSRYVSYLTPTESIQSQVDNNDDKVFNIVVPVFSSMFVVIFAILIITGGEGIVFRMCADKPKNMDKRYKSSFHE